ncbi:MAG TPA: hypothetical protein VHM92_13335 [Allosphingosinicella sp.]|nr:hypothetical protein [Allosphingosinicella sp.]
MKRAFFLLLSLGACTAQVSHPTKTMAEQEVDIDYCTRWANHKYWMDPVAALLNAYDCLEAKGYHREKAGLAEGVKKANDEQRSHKTPPEPPKPCVVPCRPAPKR